MSKNVYPFDTRIYLTLYFNIILGCILFISIGPLWSPFFAILLLTASYPGARGKPVGESEDAGVLGEDAANESSSFVF